MSGPNSEDYNERLHNAVCCIIRNHNKPLQEAIRLLQRNATSWAKHRAQTEAQYYRDLLETYLKEK